MNGTLYATDMAGRKLARLLLESGADELDAELFVLKGGVSGAYNVVTETGGAGAAPTGDGVDAELVAAFKEAGFSEPVARRMAGVDETAASTGGVHADLIAAFREAGHSQSVAERMAGDDPDGDLPTVTVPKQVPRTDLVPARESSSRRTAPPSRTGERVELRETRPRGHTVGKADYGGGRVEPAEFDESGRLVSIGGRTVR